MLSELACLRRAVRTTLAQFFSFRTFLLRRFYVISLDPDHWYKDRSFATVSDQRVVPLVVGQT